MRPCAVLIASHPGRAAGSADLGGPRWPARDRARLVAPPALSHGGDALLRDAPAGLDNGTGATWASITGELDLLNLGTFTGPVGTYRQTADLTKTQRDLLGKLNIPAPQP